MREILFRGKRINNGEWIKGFYAENGHGSSNIQPKGKFLACLVKPETVGQFTGLTDKNGNKIFEGDIVRRFNGRGQEVMRYAVKWNNDCCMFVLMCEDTYSGEYDTDFTVFYGEELGIIGNVHDNPELLKDDDILSKKLK